MKIRHMPFIALGLGATVLVGHVLLQEEAFVPSQHIEVPIPVEESVLTYSPTYTATAVVPRTLAHWFLQ